MTKPTFALIDFKKLMTLVPLKERALRSLIRDLGFTTGEGRGKLMFDGRQVRQILEAAKCSSSFRPTIGVRKTGRSTARTLESKLNELRALLQN